MPKLIKKHSVVAALFVVASCSGDFRDVAGLRRSAPDEFKVVSNAPLAMPPEFTLRPPMPGAKRPQELDIDEQAKNLLLTQSSKNQIANASKGELAFLQNADVQSANPNIKNILIQEQLDAARIEKEKGLLGKVASFAGINAAQGKAENVATEEKVAATDIKENEALSDDNISAIQPAAGGGLLNKVFGF